MIFANTIRCHNIGDAASSPFNYWPWSADSTHIDTRDYQGGPVIVGGGGLLHPGIDECVRRAVKSHPSVLWGVGSNYDTTGAKHHPDWLSDFDLVGLRDYDDGCRFRYVPCASCMHPVFDALPSPDVELAVYEHHDQPIDLDGLPTDVPRMNNWANQIPVLPADINNAIRFIARARTVITNSYHGVYWAMLAGRKTLLHKPRSTRFWYFKYQPTTFGRLCMEVLVNATPAPPDYLAECRELNQRFYSDVVNLFDL